jgi:hypothetical protein
MIEKEGASNEHNVRAKQFIKVAMEHIDLNSGIFKAKESIELYSQEKLEAIIYSQIKRGILDPKSAQVIGDKLLPLDKRYDVLLVGHNTSRVQLEAESLIAQVKLIGENFYGITQSQDKEINPEDLMLILNVPGSDRVENVIHMKFYPRPFGTDFALLEPVTPSGSSSELVTA